MRAIDILLVEDDRGDALLAKRALDRGRGHNTLNVARDGLEALRFLRREGDFVAAPRPDVILLDLNMPRMDGREFLKEMKSDPSLCQIPVVVLTTSDAASDVLRSYELQANCYITKPAELANFYQVMRSIEEFWFGVVKLPSRA
ncbi:MAG: response regulator [Planctomycetota bacterium]